MVVMETVTQIQILNKAVYISHCVNTFGKGKNQNILPPDISKIVGQTVLFNLSMATTVEKGKLNSDPLSST